MEQSMTVFLLVLTMYLLIVWYGTIYDSFLASVDDDEGKLDGRVGCRMSMEPLMFLVPLYKVLECNLLKYSMCSFVYFPIFKKQQKQ